MQLVRLLVAAVPFVFASSVSSQQHLSPETLVIEAEDFRPSESANPWKSGQWGENYFAATFANTFLSRKAFLGASEQSDGAVATQEINIPADGNYLALVRYEALPRFQTQFKLRIEQDGKVGERLYGTRENLKIWAFREKLRKEVIWSWGASENIVWEGHDAAVDLKAGPAKLSLIAGPQPAPAGRRNIDLVMLTTDKAQVERRIEKENYLPLDGMLTQAGEVFVRARNSGQAALNLTLPPCREHSPYSVHLRDWKPKAVTIVPGETTDWQEIGSLLDSFNDGQWMVKTKSSAPVSFDLEFGVAGKEGISSIRKLTGLTGDAEFAFDADTRRTRRIRTQLEVVQELNVFLKKQPVFGRPPKLTPIFGYSYDAKPNDAEYTQATEEFLRLMGTNAVSIGRWDSMSPVSDEGLRRGFLTIYHQEVPKLEIAAAKAAKLRGGDSIAVITVGDEISLPGPDVDGAVAFREWLKVRGLKPADLDPAAGDDWSKIPLDAKVPAGNPRLYYFTKLYLTRYGIEEMGRRTAVLQRYFPKAAIGANFSPHHGYPYLGTNGKYITLFREGGLTMPWSEDYIWQVPVGSQQMNFLDIDMFRSGIRDRPDGKIQMYVMPHTPGNTVNSWRRQFYGALAHGTKIINFFELRPVQVSATENHTTDPLMYAAIRRGLHELGTFEDIAQSAKVVPAQAGLWSGDTGDIWSNNAAPFGAGKRTLYVALRHLQMPLDVVTEDDAIKGDWRGLKVLYLTDRNVSRAASEELVKWVGEGGQLVATAEAGTFDEFNQPNPILRGLLGLEAMGEPRIDASIDLEKQDLPFASALTTVASKGGTPLSVYGVRSQGVKPNADAVVESRFADGSPAVVTRRSGRGGTTYVGYLPGLAYFKPAIPFRPTDRGSTDEAMAHFIPTQFATAALEPLAKPAQSLFRPVQCSNALVETNVLESAMGTVVVLNNWSGAPVKGLEVSLNSPSFTAKVTLASGKPVKTIVRNGQRFAILDLDVADALVFRP